MLRSDSSRERPALTAAARLYAASGRRKGCPGKASMEVPTSGGEKEQLSCVDSQEAAAVVVHESAVALIELFAKTDHRITRPIPQHRHWMPHGRFSGAVFNMWLHSSCCGDLATATVVGCTSSAKQCSPSYALCLFGATKRLADHRSLESLLQ